MIGHVSPAELLFFIGDLYLFRCSDLWSLSIRRPSVSGRKGQKTKNAQLNLLWQKMRRNPIGRDLHDSLGRTFAMLSVKRS